ncbi:hypothetical protein BDN71DRAFT_1513163 [Pleurotus eryngii]|uniref:Uncharacterized protein n=1 Tax=Pleurotus eryngii TaxID=5323 RepID=A0A9P5ZJP0_PLEER|nr:hypothetical protein BDN71DRAFT_1513161 [Pleurotus eryngii]KAF9488323.1 hypothetical protein BDN71DRAFT_1513163 [Pleurotus eryngii]
MDASFAYGVHRLSVWQVSSVAHIRTIADENTDEVAGLGFTFERTKQVDDTADIQEQECAEPMSSSPVKTGGPIKLETPQSPQMQTKPPTSHPPTAVPEPANPKKRVIANADLPESPKRHKKEKVKEAHADAPKPEDKPEGTSLVIQHGDEVDVQYVLSVQNKDGTYTIRSEVLTPTTVKIGDKAALFGLTSHLEGMRGGGMHKLFVPSGVLKEEGKRSQKAWLLKVRASMKVNRVA